MPILISEIHKNQPAARCGVLFVGDAILSVNGIDLRHSKHSDAVETLSKQVKNNGHPIQVRYAQFLQDGDLELEVVFVTPDQDSDDDAEVTVESEDGRRLEETFSE